MMACFSLDMLFLQAQQPLSLFCGFHFISIFSLQMDLWIGLIGSVHEMKDDEGKFSRSGFECIVSRWRSFVALKCHSHQLNTVWIGVVLAYSCNEFEGLPVWHSRIVETRHDEHVGIGSRMHVAVWTIRAHVLEEIGISRISPLRCTEK